MSTFILLVIFIFLIYFSYYYMENYNNLIYYWVLISLFASSMFILLIRNSFLTFIIGWDGLGVTSYLLVCYYSSWRRFNGGLVTVLSNKIGDIFLIWFFSLILFSSFPLLVNSYYFLLLFLAAITKRAQFPFSSWLPQAMAAPTPTRGLVHSSTLVTGGIYLILKFYPLFYTKFRIIIIFYIGWVTLFLRGILALVEIDIKKVVALRTLNQLGFIFLRLSLGRLTLVLFHLISHAFFKSCIFIPVGFFISNNEGNQDFRFNNNSYISIPLYFIILTVSIFRLIGICFIRGYYSKELILMSLIISRFWFFLGPVSIFFTILYSIKLIYIRFCTGVRVLVKERNSKRGVISIRVLFLLGCFFGRIYRNNFFIKGSFMRFFDTKLVFVMFILIFILAVSYIRNLSSILYLDNFYKIVKIMTPKILWGESWLNFILRKRKIFNFFKISQGYFRIIFLVLLVLVYLI